MPLHAGAKAAILRPTRFEDYDQIASLEREVGLNPRPRERWMHLWCNNPVYRSVAGWPIGWVLEDENGCVVGSIGNVPLVSHMGGRAHLGATLIGWAVDPRYRAFSLMLVTHQHQHRHVDFEVSTTAGPMPQAVLTRLGWSRVPVGQWDRSAFWITSYAGAIGAYLERRMPGVATAALHKIMRAGLRLGRHESASGSRFGLRWCERFDESFDAFWKEQLDRRPDMFLSSRARNTLEWHFRHFLESGDAWILAARTGPRLSAYAVFERKDARSVGLNRMLLVDFQMLEPDPALASAMLRAGIERCRAENIHVLENIGCWMDRVELAGRHPGRHRALKCWCYLYKAADPELAGALENPACWYPTQYDGDASL
ncbi:MAG TPA: hypothetical protein VMG40_17570 [Bryobacteraceae bacterium]|nr:hypothetical protein [Bryobacteraceae bacterium]